MSLAVRFPDLAHWKAQVKCQMGFYARPPGASTPMGYDIAAFATRKEAASRDREGRARSWNELVRELRAQAGGR